MSGSWRLELRDITKRYPGCVANDAISLKVAPGEIHALLGENGAGKSTLMRIIYGVTQADAGEILWDGRPVRFEGPVDARRHGIGMVFQHFSLFETLTVGENILLAMPPGQRLSRQALSRRIRELGERYRMPLSPDAYVQQLSMGERQRLEILRCLIQETRLLILDEPTSVLTPNEVEPLFETLRQLASEGTSIVFISHKLKEVAALCQRATILRHGRVTGECDPTTTSTTEMARLMVGSETAVATHVDPGHVGSERLVIEALDGVDSGGGERLHGAGFSLHGGEIVGIAGVAGNGQEALLELLSGEAPIGAGSITLDGRPISAMSPARRRRLGLAVVPSERLGRGAVPDMSLADNTLLTAADDSLIDRGGWLRSGAIRDYAERIVRTFKVKADSAASPARSLSGGNLQKFIIGREVLKSPGVLVAAHPTWGVDIGSATAIHETLVALRNAGTVILLVSEDIDELFLLCDRIGALHDGHLSPLWPSRDLTLASLGRWMTTGDTGSTHDNGEDSRVGT